MKSKKEIQKECIGDVYTTKEFVELVCDGCILEYDGIGYLHDGNKETNISVWSNDEIEKILKYPFVCWYNK